MIRALTFRLPANHLARMAALLSAGLAFGAVTTAVTLQLVYGWAPCPWCILQRYAYLALGGLALLWAVLPERTAGAHVLPWLATVAAVSGMGMAAFQLRVASSSALTCGRDTVGEFVNGLWPAAWAPTLFEATGSCSDPLPVNFPALSLVGFIGLASVLLLVLRRR